MIHCLAVKLSQCLKAQFGSTGQIAGAFLIKRLNRCHTTSQSTHGQSILVVISNVGFAIVMEQSTEKKLGRFHFRCSALYLAVISDI